MYSVYCTTAATGRRPGENATASKVAFAITSLFPTVAGGDQIIPGMGISSPSTGSLPEPHSLTPEGGSPPPPPPPDYVHASHEYTPSLPPYVPSPNPLLPPPPHPPTPYPPSFPPHPLPPPRYRLYASVITPSPPPAPPPRALFTVPSPWGVKFWLPWAMCTRIMH